MMNLISLVTRPLAAAAVVGLACGWMTTARADTVLWHRYEDESASPTTDSTMEPANSGNMTGPVPYTFGAAPAAISNIYSPSISNTKVLNLAADQSDLVPDTNTDIMFGAGSSWTMEGFVNLNTLSTAVTGGQWLLQKKAAASDGLGDYGFLANVGNRTDSLFTGSNEAFGYLGSDPNKISFEWGNGVNFFSAISNLAIDSPGDWYYMGAAVQANMDGSGNVTFFLKNMTDAGPLLTETVNIPSRGWYESVSPLRIGGKQSGMGVLAQGIVGQIDEVRISNVALTPTGLLVPEPSGIVLTGLGALGLVAMAMRRGKGCLGSA